MRSSVFDISSKTMYIFGKKMSKNSNDAHATGLCISCENLSKCIVFVTENVEFVHGFEENSFSIKSD